MKTRIIAMTMMLCAAFVSPAYFYADDKTVSAEEIRASLKELKLDVKEEKDDEDKTVFIITGKDELITIIYQYGGKGDLGTSIGIRAEFSSEDERSLAPINAYNRDERFAKAYIDDEDNIVLEDDLDAGAGVSKEVIQRFVGNFIDSVPSFLEQITD